MRPSSHEDARLRLGDARRALLTILTLSIHGVAQAVLTVLLAATLVVVVALMAIWLTVVLLGRPRRLVPPGLRRGKRR
jgi:hypothetical protein